jgi:photosystem II stability/assembly factor-like uncharacterized protein
VVMRWGVLVAAAVGIPAALGGAPERFEPVAIAFRDPQHGVVAAVRWHSCDARGRCSFRLETTDDGGTTWTGHVQLRARGFPPAVLSAVPGTSTIWLAAAPLVLRSDDGGRAWRRVGRSFSEVSFADARTGWAVSSTGIDATADGARSWTHLRSPCRRALATEVHVSLASPAQGWVLCEGEPGAGQQPKAVYTTSTAGRTWRLRSSAVAPGLGVARAGRRLPGSGYAHGISFRPSGVGWLWESRGSFVATRDGGRTWHPLAVGEPEIVEAQSAQLLSDRAGFALLRRPGDVALERTTDGGRSWRVVRTWPR